MSASHPLAPPLPDRLQVEVTAACNLRCRMCIVRYQPPYARSASMSLSTFQQLIDPLPDLREVVLQGIGEPLLAPDIYAMVAYASARGIRCGFNSNATLLTHVAGERLLDAGIDWLCFSLDGASKATYEFVREGARWESVTENIARFAGQARARGADGPRLSLVMVLMQRNLHELPALIEQAAVWGIPTVFAQNLSHDFSDAPPETYAAIAAYVNEQRTADLPAGEVEAVYRAARSVAQRHGVTLRLPALEARAVEPDATAGPACSWPWDSGYVRYDGTVLPCCMVMGDNRVTLGRVGEQSYAAIWSAEQFQDFRAGLLNGVPHAVCRGCSLYRGAF
jgi:radical SAM protein with 4Fe4S-binding SPASM domain